MTCFMRSIFKIRTALKTTPPRLPYRTPNIYYVHLFFMKVMIGWHLTKKNKGHQPASLQECGLSLRSHTI